MPIEKSFRRFSPYFLGKEPQLLEWVHRYGVELGLELSLVPEYHWIAEEFACAPLPSDMAVVKGDTFEDTYFYNTQTMETAWVHPSTELFREIAKFAVENHLNSLDTVVIKAKLDKEKPNDFEICSAREVSFIFLTNMQ